MAKLKPQKLCLSLFLCIVFSITGRSAAQNQFPSICESTCKKNINSTETEKYCSQYPGLEIKQRCCMNSSTSEILGIDLQQCDLTREKFISGIANLSHLVIISLEGNKIGNVMGTDFGKNIQIQYLSLPPSLDCPGGNYSWGHEDYSSTKTVCKDELNPCFSPRNYTCPDYSYCVHVGVNMTNCLCEKGYHGYKCLKEGKFPFFEFGLGIGIPTLILCIFLWFTQRRYVKTRPKST